MATKRYHEGLGSARGAFTLLEIIIVLAVISVLLGLCVPFISGMLREQQMREPIRELQGLAKAVRDRAMAERVPYEINFSSDGFLGCKHLLYAEESDTDSAPPKKTGTDGEPADDAEATEDEVIARYTLAPEMTCRVLYWGSSRWVEPSTGVDAEQCRWVFQPSGLCNPIRVQFHKGNAWIEASFNPITADIQEERYSIPD